MGFLSSLVSNRFFSMYVGSSLRLAVSDGSGSDFPGIERVGYFIFLNFRVSSGSGI